MKTITVALSVLVLTGSLGVSFQRFVNRPYHPVLKDADSGDIIDFDGPCDLDPLGKDEIHVRFQ